MKQVGNYTRLLILFVLFASATIMVEAHKNKCKPSGKIKGKKAPKHDDDNNSNFCKEGKHYTTYKCSPPVTKRTKATLTINSFQKGGDGGAPSECDNKYHNDDTPVVALSTGWFNKKKRCHKYIRIHGNGRSTKARVVDECDSTVGCDSAHGHQPPCANNIVDASKAVWKALGLKESDDRWGWMDITWTDA